MYDLRVLTLLVSSLQVLCEGLSVPGKVDHGDMYDSDLGGQAVFRQPESGEQTVVQDGISCKLRIQPD